MGSFILGGVLHLTAPRRHTADRFCPAEPKIEYVRPNHFSDCVVAFVLFSVLLGACGAGIP